MDLRFVSVSLDSAVNYHVCRITAEFEAGWKEGFHVKAGIAHYGLMKRQFLCTIKSNFAPTKLRVFTVKTI